MKLSKSEKQIQKDKLLLEIRLLCEQNFGMKKLISDQMNLPRQYIQGIIIGVNYASIERLKEILEHAKNLVGKKTPKRKMKKKVAFS